MTIGPKIPGAVIPRGVFTQPGSTAAVTSARTLGLLHPINRPKFKLIVSSEKCRYCSLIPGLGVKLSTTVLAGPTVLSAVGDVPSA